MPAPKLAADAQRHAHRILDVVRQGARADANDASDAVARSWSRCVHDYRLHPDRPPEPARLARAELEGRRERLADVIDCARHEMTTLYQQLADEESAVVLTDTDGVIVHMVAAPAFAAEAAALGLVPGAQWSETLAGTNGMGTCLAAGQPIAVRRGEHFFTRYTALTCSAVPLADPSGEIAAVLDVTSRSGLAQQHLLVLLGMTARMIENRLIDRRCRDAHPLHFHSRPEFVYTLHEGRLALADDGRVLAANRSALLQLGAASVAELRRRRVDEIFQTSLEDMLERSASASFHPVVTYRADASHRFFAVARRPAGANEGAPRPAAKVPRPAADGAPLFADPRLAAQLETARRVVARGTPLLLAGETGSGKEVFARAVHAASPNAAGAFVAVNCASLPESLIEAELFGYRAGAFTGAQRGGRRGKVLAADGGSLFLDEIGDMPLALQARLLRVLDERQVTPLGSEETQPVEFQLLSASHRDLRAAVREGRFREDLYYRLAGIELALPPLRERSDRRELIRRVLAEEAGAGLSAAAEKLLLAHDWPGNVRQLRHVLRGAAALADGATIGVEHLTMLEPAPAPVATGAAPAGEGDAAPAPRLNALQAEERRALLELLEQQRWNVSLVARSLGLSRNTLYRKLHKLRIPVSHPA